MFYDTYYSYLYYVKYIICHYYCQRKHNLICDLYEIIKVFRKQLSLFEEQLEGGNVSHFAKYVNLEFQNTIIHCFRSQQN